MQFIQSRGILICVLCITALSDINILTWVPSTLTANRYQFEGCESVCNTYDPDYTCDTTQPIDMTAAQCGLLWNSDLAGYDASIHERNSRYSVYPDPAETASGTGGYPPCQLHAGGRLLFVPQTESTFYCSSASSTQPISQYFLCSCDTGETCATVDCDDGDACTVDTCDPVTGCIHTPKCEAHQECDAITGDCTTPPIVWIPSSREGRHCRSVCANYNAVFRCERTQQFSLTPDQCDDLWNSDLVGYDPAIHRRESETVTETGASAEGNDPRCQLDANGQLFFLRNTASYINCDSPATKGYALCSCTTADQCESLDCDDGDNCTDDSCDSQWGCINTPRCVDSDKCTEDTCDAATGECTHTDVNCDDGDLCTADTCDVRTGGCLNTELDCDDGDKCTEDTCDPARGECANIDVDCDDGDPCTIDTCSPDTGACVHVPKCGDYLICDDDTGTCLTPKIYCTSHPTKRGSHKKRCENGNKLNNGNYYIFNDNRGEKVATCRKSSTCWCCKRKYPDEWPLPLRCTRFPGKKGYHRSRCEAGNRKNDGYLYFYNSFRGTKNAICGKDARCYCCRAKIPTPSSPAAHSTIELIDDGSGSVHFDTNTDSIVIESGSFYFWIFIALIVTVICVFGTNLIHLIRRYNNYKLYQNVPTKSDIDTDTDADPKI